MNKANVLKKQEGLATLARPRFSPGLLLEDEDLTASVEYTRNMLRLMFRSLFGCGVICGLRVDAKRTCNGSRLAVTVHRGVALDCMGNPIEVPSDQTLEYDPDCKPLPPYVWVTVCYMEKCCRPRDVGCGPDDDSHVVHTRSRDGYEIRLYDQPPECACSCEPVPEKPPTPAHDCCKEPRTDSGKAAEPVPAIFDELGPRDLCACYDDHMKGVCECDCGCNCVVIGRVATGRDTSDAPLATGDEVRRFIRPLLAGWWLCHQRKRRDQEDLEQQPAEQTGNG